MQFLILIRLGYLNGSNIVCAEEKAIFDCARIVGTLIGWTVTSTCGSYDYEISFSFTSSVGESIVDTLCSTTLMFTVTSLTSSSISVTLTIRTLVLLSGTIISCGGQTVTLHVLSSKL